MARKPHGRPRTRQSGPREPDDMHLWRAVTKSVHPLAGRVARLAALAPQPQPPASPKSLSPKAQSAESQSAEPGRAESGRAGPVKSAPMRMPAYTPPRRDDQTASAEARLDPRLVRKVTRGRTRVDATIDLHGLKQAAAEQRLYTFLAQCQARGARMVLIITGKGRISEPGAAVMAGPEPGVLKRMVPHWLAQPRFRALVVGHREAARQHGGAGALYVQLRRAQRMRE